MAEALGKARHAPGARSLSRAWQVAAVVGLATFTAHVAFGLGGPRLDPFFNYWVYEGLELLAVAACVLRAALVRAERAAWASLAVGALGWTVGDIVYDFVYGGRPPFPSVADGFYLAFYPACYLALVLLVRARLSSFNRSLWLDGVMALLAAAAAGASVLLEVVLDHTHGRPALIATNLAYPLGDILLLALVVGVFALTGWRPGRTWTLIGLSLILGTVADGVFLYQSSTNTYAEGTILDALWPASLLLLALSAWQPVTRRPGVELRGRALFATPAVCGLIALGVLASDHVQPLNVLAIALGGATIVTVLARTGLTFRENADILARTRTQAITDALTGLGSRRKLIADLERLFAASEQAEARILILFDLDGFKQYNDTFGHPAGDALLSRLADKLNAAGSRFGSSCYRLGGDEFCVLADVAAADAETLIDATVMALKEDGEGFAVSSSFGTCFLREEAADVSSALRIADQRLYAHKHAALIEREQPHEVLLQALHEHEPDLRKHLADVAALSLRLGRRLGLNGQQLEELKLAAELHDVGKLAIPDTVLEKPGPLSEEEWRFVRQHTIVGQRILSASPALHGVARIVRATHERWDGTGYVDGLVGDDIPLAARIIAVCDAFAAMTSDQAYRATMSSEQALDELRRCAGTQFDPEMVEAFCDEYASLPASAPS